VTITRRRTLTESVTITRRRTLTESVTITRRRTLDSLRYIKMGPYDYKEFTRRNLPHFHPIGATLFVTFRLAGTVPLSEVRLYQAQKEWFEKEKRRLSRSGSSADSPDLCAYAQRLREFRRGWFVRFEDILHKAANGPTWLRDDRVAEVIAAALHERDGNVYRLEAYCIMVNHVHIVFSPFLSAEHLEEVSTPTGLHFISSHPPLNAIMKSLKGYSAWAANRVLGRKGTFWQTESYDHVIRDDTEFYRTVRYVLENPVKAALVKEWRDWRWSFRREDG
jgi:REP-associated tyrosine transposase